MNKKKKQVQPTSTLTPMDICHSVSEYILSSVYNIFSKVLTPWLQSHFSAAHINDPTMQKNTWSQLLFDPTILQIPDTIVKFYKHLDQIKLTKLQPTPEQKEFIESYYNNTTDWGSFVIKQVLYKSSNLNDVKKIIFTDTREKWLACSSLGSAGHLTDDAILKNTSLIQEMLMWKQHRNRFPIPITASTKEKV